MCHSTASPLWAALCALTSDLPVFTLLEVRQDKDRLYCYYLGAVAAEAAGILCVALAKELRPHLPFITCRKAPTHVQVSQCMLQSPALLLCACWHGPRLTD